ncbi:MAG TPA: hypothetical protein VN112_24345 [Ensifer sp.]|nr:hypothetical protein [Ensifer sp.]
MTMALVIASAVGAYFVTLAFLLFIVTMLRDNVRPFRLLGVPPYGPVAKWLIIGVSAWTAYLTFQAVG